MADEPEIWISDSSESDDAQRGSGHGRWIALAAGFAALLALIAIQHFASGSTNDDTAPTPSVSVTPPPGTSGSLFTGAPTTAPGTTAPDASANQSGVTTTRSVGQVIAAAVNPMPSTGATAPAGLSGTPFELVGLQWNGAVSSVAAVVRYRSDTGATVRTEVPSLLGDGSLSFVAAAGATVIRTRSNGFPYVVPDGAPAVAAKGLLQYQGQVFPAADPRQVWTTAHDYQGSVTLVLADPISGAAAGRTIAMPPSLSGTVNVDAALTPDGAGYVLARAVGGVYDLRPGKTQLVTRGAVLATGPTGYLVYECDEAAQCACSVIDRDGTQTPLPEYMPRGPATNPVQGVVSPDSSYAAVLGLGPGPDDPPLGIVDLHTGSYTPVPIPIEVRQASTDGASAFAFTTDSRVLIAISGDYVRAIDPATGGVLGELPVPPLRAIAIRPVG